MMRILQKTALIIVLTIQVGFADEQLIISRAQIENMTIKTQSPSPVSAV